MYEKSTPILEGVNIELSGNKVKVSGTKGNIEKTFPNYLSIEKDDGRIKVSSKSDKKKQRAIVGTTLAHIRNMIEGVKDGYIYKLKVVFSHFPTTVKVEKDKVIIQNFVGERKPRTAKVVGDSKVDVKNQDITVSGIDIDEVSQTAGNIELATRITGYDKKIFQDGIWITSKGD